MFQPEKLQHGSALTSVNWGSNMACSRSIIEHLVWTCFTSAYCVLIPAADVQDIEYFPFLLLPRTTRRTNASEDEEHEVHSEDQSPYAAINLMLAGQSDSVETN